MKKLLGIGLVSVLLAACAQPAPPAAAPPEPPQGEQAAEAPADLEEAPLSRLDAILERGVITMATSPDYAPFTFVDPRLTGVEGIVGADIEFARFVAERLGVELEIQPMDFTASLAAVQTGSVDFNVGGLTWVEEREQAMMLTSPYNAGTIQGILVPVDRAAELATAEDFAGLTLAAQNASLQLNLVTEQLPEATPQVIAAVPEGILMVLGGHVDGVVLAGIVGEQFANNYPDLVMSDFTFDVEHIGTVAVMPLGSYELFDAFEEIIAYVVENDLYSQWMAEASALADELAIN